MHGLIEPAVAPPAPEAAPVSALLAEAMTLHHAWDFARAEALYREILARAPGHADACHNLGVLLAVHLMRPAEALPLFEAALNSDPHSAQYWFSYVDALVKARQFQAARQILPLAAAQGVEAHLVTRLEEDLAMAEQPLAPPAVAHWQPPAGEPRPASAGRAPAPRRTGFEPPAREVQRLVELFNRREWSQGEQLARRLAGRHPRSGAVWKILGAMQQQLGRHEEALQAKTRAAELLPDDAEAQCNLGNTLVSAGRPEDALACFARAVALRPGYAEAYFNQGNALLALERPADAEAAFRQARALAPQWPDAHSNLGFALKQQMRLAEAAESYEHALALAPQDPTTLTNLGVVRDALDQGEAALQCFRLALSLRPNDPDLQGAYAVALHKLGKFSLAETAYRQALLLAPDTLLYLKRLALLLQQQGRLEEAETCLRRCVAEQPDSANALFDLGTNLIEQKKWDAAEEALRAAIALEPRHENAHINLSKTLYERGDYERAIQVVKESIALLPDVPSLHTNLGVACTMLGRVEEGVAAYRRALSIDPDFLYARSCMLYAVSHSEHVDAEALAREHFEFGARAQQAVQGKVRLQHGNDRDPERQLRVGFVSADFREHAVAKFFIPFIQAFARREDVRTYAYYNHAAHDAATRSIMQHFAVWRPVAGLSDDRLDAQIRDDQIDVLIDLSGHTAGHRLLTFARKPAPVQVTWGGYPGTTGLEAMDYRFVEHFFLESEAFNRQFTEKFVQLPAVSAFNGMEHAVDAGASPCMRNGFITFGSFNRLSKINPGVVDGWCEVLRALPSARLLMAAMPAEGPPPALRNQFKAAGIAEDRLIFKPRLDFSSYLTLHQQVDLCLDTFPYTGGTTTNHALWMGVPTLTVAGDTYASRQSAMLLHRVGLHKACVAGSVQGMVEQATAWAERPALLERLRGQLRPVLEQAQETHLDVVVAGVARAIRRAWQRWCVGQPAAPMTITFDEIAMARPPRLALEELQ